MTNAVSVSTEVSVGDALTEHVTTEILAHMGRRRINQSELGRRLGESHVWVHRRLSGRVPLDVSALARIAQVLGVEVTVLFPAGGTGLPHMDSNHEPTDGGAHLVATGGEPRRPRPTVLPVAYKGPGRPVRQTRPLTPVAR